MASYWIESSAQLREPGSSAGRSRPRGRSTAPGGLGAEPPFPRRLKDPTIYRRWLGTDSVRGARGAFCQSRIDAASTAASLHVRPPECHAFRREVPAPVIVRRSCASSTPMPARSSWCATSGTWWPRCSPTTRSAASRDSGRDRPQATWTTSLGRVAASVGRARAAWRARQRAAHLLRYEDLVLPAAGDRPRVLELPRLDASADRVDAMLETHRQPDTDGTARPRSSDRSAAGRRTSRLSCRTSAARHSVLALRAFGYRMSGAPPATIVVAGSVAQRPGKRRPHLGVPPVPARLPPARLGRCCFLDRLEPDMCVDERAGRSRRASRGTSLPAGRSCDALRPRRRATPCCSTADDARLGLGPGRGARARSAVRAAAQRQRASSTTRRCSAAPRCACYLDIDPGFGQMWRALGLHDPFARPRRAT